MGFWQQFRALMWKNFLLKKQHYGGTLIEILVPVGLMCLMVLLRSVIRKTTHDSFFDVYHDGIVYSEITSTNLMIDYGIFFTSNSNYYKFGVSGNNSYTTRYIDYVTSKYGFDASWFKVFDSSSDFRSYILRNDYGKSTSTPYIAIYVEWKNVIGPDFDYVIWMNTTVSGAPNTQVLTAQCVETSYVNPVEVLTNTFDMSSVLLYLGFNYSYQDPHKGSFVGLQMINDQFIMENITGIQNFTYPSLTIRPFPTPPYVQDTFANIMQSVLGFLLTLTFIYPTTCIVKLIVEEKERRIKEGMKIMGLSEHVIWTSWFTLYLIIFGITSALITFVTAFSVFEFSNKFLIFIIFLEFTMGIYAFGYLVSVFFSRAKVGSTIGGLLLLALLAPIFAIKATTPAKTLQGASLSIIVDFYFTMYLVFNFESYSIGANWNNINVEYQGYSIGEGMGFLFLDIVIYLTIGIYLSYVLPSAYGVPRKWYFLCEPSFWTRKPRKSRPQAQENEENEVLNQKNFENLKPDTSIGIAIRHLRKEFSATNTLAVADLSLNMYYGEIFALLGHNGAGKTTTINMLTGMYPPSSGDARIGDKWITEDMHEIRSQIGFCPQHDILYDDLTVREHLIFYGNIKGMSSDELSTAVDEIIVDVGLEEKVHAQTKTLSGGQKRKLSVAIALLGTSKVVFLDEPTSGMDVFYRRHMWDLLKKKKKDRVIVLTTHFMDEADYLGDRIAIMAHGAVQCCGSSLYLKNLYGVGYTMTIVKKSKLDSGDTSQSKTFPSQPIIDLVNRDMKTDDDEKDNEFVDKKTKVTILSDSAGEVSFRLPFQFASRFPKLFQDLDNSEMCDQLGINHYAMSVTTLEEVFLRVGSANVTDIAELEEDKKSVQQIIANRQNSANTIEIPKVENEKNDEKGEYIAMETTDKTASESAWRSYSINDMHPNFWQHVYGLLTKRFHNIKRDKRFWCCQFVIPFLIVLMGLALMKVGLALSSPPAQLLNADEYNQPLIVPYYLGDNKTVNFSFVNESRDYSEMQKITTNELDNITWFGFSVFLENTRQETKNSRFGAYFIQNDTVTIFVNVTARDSVPIYLNLLNRNYIRQFTNDKSYTIDVSYQPYPLTHAEEIEFQAAAGFYIAIALSFVPASFAWYIVNERQVNIKHQQIISGVNLISYWLSNWIFDFVDFFIVTLPVIIIIESYKVEALIGNNLKTTVSLFVAYSFSAPTYAYCLSFLFKNPSSAQNLLIIVFMVTGAFLNIIIIILSNATASYPTHLTNLWRIMPNYAFAEALTGLLNLGDSYIPSSETRWSWEITGRDLTFMFSTGVGFFLLTLAIEYSLQAPKLIQYILNGFKNVEYDPDIAHEDVDVLEEMKRVESGASDKDNDIIILKNLRKVYGGSGKNPEKVAVHNLSFGIHNGECFGFLGMNGAGKTTTLKILSGDTFPTSGTASMNKHDVMVEPHAVRKYIGYCPQFDAQLPLMTGREHLILFARIKGIPENRINDFVHALIQEIGLTEYADKPSGGYSGGNKRKLSVGMALIGNPPIVFLDEPSTGIDPSSRRFMWNLIASTMTGRSVILTTHSMEEAEALCNRIGIMVNGRLSCLGPAAHLRSRFGQGYQIDVNFEITHQTNVESSNQELVQESKLFQDWIQNHFKQWELLEQQNTHFKYRVDKSMSLGKIFEEIQKNKDYFKVREYSVSQTSLEQIFMYFARRQVREDGTTDFNTNGNLNTNGNFNSNGNNGNNNTNTTSTNAHIELNVTNVSVPSATPTASVNHTEPFVATINNFVATINNNTYSS